MLCSLLLLKSAGSTPILSQPGSKLFFNRDGNYNQTFWEVLQCQQNTCQVSIYTQGDPCIYYQYLQYNNNEVMMTRYSASGSSLCSFDNIYNPALELIGMSNFRQNITVTAENSTQLTDYVVGTISIESVTVPYGTCSTCVKSSIAQDLNKTNFTTIYWVEPNSGLLYKYQDTQNTYELIQIQAPNTSNITSPKVSDSSATSPEDPSSNASPSSSKVQPTPTEQVHSPKASTPSAEASSKPNQVHHNGTSSLQRISYIGTILVIVVLILTL